jgi:hypothetical protein
MDSEILKQRFYSESTGKQEFAFFRKIFEKYINSEARVSQIASEMLSNGVSVDPKFRFPHWMGLHNDHFLTPKYKNIVEEHLLTLNKVLRFINKTSDDPLEDLPLDFDGVI